nr:TetR/AcrR family transcriptional regulator [Rhodococcus koreensis]
MVTQPRTAELLWGSPDRPKRGPKPALSLERIVATAISMADAEGLATLSMQRLAEDLGFTKMSLYRYTPGKAELTALMLDAALGPAPDLSEIDGVGAQRSTSGHCACGRVCDGIRGSWTSPSAPA